MARLTLVAAGFAPVSLIAVAAFGLGELRHTATYVLIPVLALAVVAAWRLRRTPRHFVLAVAMGVLATSMYDLLRFGFLAMGWMAGDPIPHIGRALDLHPASDLRLFVEVRRQRRRPRCCLRDAGAARSAARRGLRARRMRRSAHHACEFASRPDAALRSQYRHRCDGHQRSHDLRRGSGSDDRCSWPVKSTAWLRSPKDAGPTPRCMESAASALDA